ncbi:hypothetical protein VNI00_003030 [Paramarasmius palmivorus]|uniref:Alpha/beta hydrolase fold-3 domain-containing protein n=1 Tax=Paramarasmius palmivorus TaxID=297713 RepID=A0AAW0DXF7_9AGAR
MKPPTIWEKLSLLPKSLPLPVILAYTALISLFKRNKAKTKHQKTLARVLNERTVRYLTSNISVPQLQWASPSTTGLYRQWTKKQKIPQAVEYTPEDVAVMWIGPKDAKDIIVVAHGGGYMLAVSDFMLIFWHYVRRELQRKGHETSIVFFEYSIYPNTFPTQLKQYIHTLNYILTSQPTANIHLAGDSAGANLNLQLFTHTVRPVTNSDADVPASPLASADNAKRIKNVLLISPWTSLGLPAPERPNEEDVDIFAPETISRWGKLYLEKANQEHLPYIRFTRDFGFAFKGISAYIPNSRVYIFVGAKEILREDGLGVYGVLKTELSGPESEGDKVFLELQEDGVHDDPMVHVATGKELSDVGKGLVDWLAAGL